MTQQLAGRAWAVLVIGFLVGATAAALVATYAFHADSRARKLAADRASISWLRARARPIIGRW
ncbi:hypothetical protein ACWPKO_28675 (plasmid) [Coraliomargarita sp. W4R53]